MGSRTLPQVKQRTGMIIFFCCPNCSGVVSFSCVSMEEGFHEVYYLYKGNHSGRVKLKPVTRGLGCVSFLNRPVEGTVFICSIIFLLLLCLIYICLK